MNRIYKYTLQVKDRQTVKMPRYSRILSVQNQGDVITLWVEVNLDQPDLIYPFLIVGTGHDLPGDYGLFRYLDTVQIGSLVWHVHYFVPIL